MSNHLNGWSFVGADMRRPSPRARRGQAPGPCSGVAAHLPEKFAGCRSSRAELQTARGARRRRRRTRASLKKGAPHPQVKLAKRRRRRPQLRWKEARRHHPAGRRSNGPSAPWWRAPPLPSKPREKSWTRRGAPAMEPPRPRIERTEKPLSRAGLLRSRRCCRGKERVCNLRCSRPAHTRADSWSERRFEWEDASPPFVGISRPRRGRAWQVMGRSRPGAVDPTID